MISRSIDDLGEKVSRTADSIIRTTRGRERGKRGGADVIHLERHLLRGASSSTIDDHVYTSILNSRGT